MNKFILLAFVASVAFAAAGAGTISQTQPAGLDPKPASRSNGAAGAGTSSQTQSDGRDPKVASRNNGAAGVGTSSQIQSDGRDPKVASRSNGAAGVGTSSQIQSDGRDPKVSSRSNGAAGVGTSSQIQSDGRDPKVAARSNAQSEMAPSKINPTQQNQQNGKIEKKQVQTKNTPIKKEPEQPLTSNSPAKNKEEENSLRNFWDNMNFDQQETCSKIYDHHKSTTDDSISDIGWKGLTIAVIRTIWDDLKQKTKACLFHIYEEESKAAKEKKAEEAKKASNKVKPNMPPSKTNPPQSIQPNDQNDKSQSQIKSSSIKKESVKPMNSNSPAKNQTEERSLRHYWLRKMDLEQKTDCYQMYNKDQSPADYAISNSEWKSLTKEGRLAAIKAIWSDLRQKIKACAYRMYEQEVMAPKAKKLEEAMRRRIAQNLKRNQLLGNNAKKGDDKKTVYGVATKEEAILLRHRWESLDLDFMTECYELYEQVNENPTREQYLALKMMDQTKRKEEVDIVWPTLSEDMQACVIHIADEETKMGETLLY